MGRSSSRRIVWSPPKNSRHSLSLVINTMSEDSPHLSLFPKAAGGQQPGGPVGQPPSSSRATGGFQLRPSLLPFLTRCCEGGLTALYCAHRATTFSSWGLCELKGQSG